MPQKIEFTTQRGTIYSEIGCGVASALMLLKAANLPTPSSFKKMGELLAVNVPAIKKWGKDPKDCDLGAYTRDITRYLSDEQIGHVAISDENKTDLSMVLLASLLQNPPIMVGMAYNEEDWGDGGHWIVIVSTGLKSVRYYDPYKTSREQFEFTMKRDKFYSEWDGQAIAITDKRKA